MGWAKFDDRWPTHPKLLAAGLEAKGLDASGICYAAGQETDGFIPDNALPIIASGHRDPHKVARVLVSVGRWTRDDERKGYVIHDYLIYNPTKAAREAEREEKRAAGRLGGMRSAQARRPRRVEAEPKQSASSTVLQAEAKQMVEPDPKHPGELPSRPVPTPSNNSSSSHHVGGAGSDEEEEDSRIQDAVRLVAERRLAARTGDPVTNATAWLRAVRNEIITDHLGELHELAALGLNAKTMADRIMPLPRSPYPLAGEEQERPWDEVEDESGHLAVVLKERVG